MIVLSLLAFMSFSSGAQEWEGYLKGPNILADNQYVLAKKSSSTSKNPQTEGKVYTKVVAYYFHGNYRCYTCQTIERYSRDAIEKYFAGELQNKRLEFRPVNVDMEENRHFIQDYQLYTRSLVIVLYRNNQQETWKNLKDVWIYIRNQGKFDQYVKTEIESFLIKAK
jgi:hypothetical protein